MLRRLVAARFCPRALADIVLRASEAGSPRELCCTFFLRFHPWRPSPGGGGTLRSLEVFRSDRTSLLLLVTCLWRPDPTSSYALRAVGPISHLHSAQIAGITPRLTHSNTQTANSLLLLDCLCRGFESCFVPVRKESHLFEQPQPGDLLPSDVCPGGGVHGQLPLIHTVRRVPCRDP